MEKHFYYVSTRYKDSCDKNKVVFDSVLERCVTLLPSSPTTCLHLALLLSRYSDTPLIDHLVMREFVSGPPSYRFIYERVRDRKPSLRKGS